MRGWIDWPLDTVVNRVDMAGCMIKLGGRIAVARIGVGQLARAQSQPFGWAPITRLDQTRFAIVGGQRCRPTLIVD